MNSKQFKPSEVDLSDPFLKSLAAYYEFQEMIEAPGLGFDFPAAEVESILTKLNAKTVLARALRDRTGSRVAHVLRCQTDFGIVQISFNKSENPEDSVSVCFIDGRAEKTLLGETEHLGLAKHSNDFLSYFFDKFQRDFHRIVSDS